MYDGLCKFIVIFAYSRILTRRQSALCAILPTQGSVKGRTAITIHLSPLEKFFNKISHYDISSLHKRLSLTGHIPLCLLIA
jgi:hypothetical protein